MLCLHGDDPPGAETWEASQTFAVSEKIECKCYLIWVFSKMDTLNTYLVKQKPAMLRY